jgi:alpha-galactosidase
VAIISATPGATIRYTLDGTTPSSTTGTPYSGPLNIAASTTLKALAFASGATDSAVTTGVYTLSFLPSPWQAADIGAVGPSGTTSFGSGVFSVAGSGADIEGTADAFRYVYQAANGDVTIVARVATLQNTDYWAKSGVMIRESAAPGSVNAAVLVSSEGGVVFQRRSSTSGSTAVSRVEGLRAPRWVKLVRTGNSFSAYHSADGAVWTQIETSQTINMAASATVGLAVCSHRVDNLGESTLDNVAVSGGSGGVTPPAPSPTIYEAESGIRNGSANLENNNQYVGNLGNGIDNWVEIRNVSVSVGGTYRVTVSYASGDDTRALTLRMNGNDATRITQNVPNTGGWNTTGTITYDIVLQSGINIIRFYNANTSGNTYAPPVDKITIPVSPLPSITATGSLVAVNTTFPNASPTPTSFTFSGTAMAAGILVTPPAGFEVSTASAGPYSSTLTLGVAGTIASTQIFVRLAANTPPGTYSGNVVLSSFSATSVNVATVSSTVTAVSTISAGTGTLTGVSATHPNASTTVRTFTVSGSSMRAGITATAPAGFEVSADGVSFASSVTFGAAGTINSTTISVRLAANTPAGSYSGNIILSSPGAVSQIRAIDTSTVTGGPAITLGSTSLRTRSTTSGTASSTRTFTVFGSSMTAGITVVAPAGFEISVGTNPYASSILIGSAGTIDNTTVNVRLAAATRPGTYSGNITLNSPGAPQRTVATNTWTVNPTSAAITLSGTLLPFSTSFGSASEVQTFTVSGASMAAAITVAVPAGFEVSVNGGAYASSITVGAAGTINATTVSIRLAANTPSGTYSGTITANSTGATQRTLSIPTGTVAAIGTISYSLSGTVVSAGNSLPGVLMTLTGDTTSSVVSDRNGNYLLSGLPNGTYTVTPSKPGHVFQPSSKTVTIADANQSAQDFSHSYDPATTVTIPFGTGNSIVYNRGSKSYDVFYGTDRIITQALAKAKNGNVTLNSSDYTTATVTNASHTDGIGSGTTYTVTLTGTGLSQMQQMFYVYDSVGYFFTEVSIQGTSLSSNYMAPLATSAVSLPVAGEYRSLFVPFDNDTNVRYDAKPLAESVTSSEVGAIYENTSRTGIVAGSVQSDRWKTGVKAVGTGTQLSELTVWGGYADIGVTRDQRAHGSLVGSSLKSPRMFVGYFSDFRDGMELYGKAVNVFSPRYIFNYTGSTPFAYNTWGDIQNDLTLTKAKAVADFVHTQIPAFRSDNKVFIDLDSYWDNLVSGGLTGDFSQLTEFANYCKARGLQPGIYWAPFVDWGKTERSVEGASAFNYRDLWTKVNGGFHELNGTRALDPTHPGTKLRINLVIDKFKACGFEFIKLDFIGHAAVEADSWHDTSVKTGYQAFHQGMKYLTDRLDNKMVVYAAISPNVATGPYAHIRRVACDAFAQINDTEYTMNSVAYGWWQSHIYNFIDADHIVFGSRYEASATEGENRARFASALTCGPIVLGDDFSNPDTYSNRIKDYAQREVLLDISRKGGKAFRPVETHSGSAAVDAYCSQVGNDMYVVVFNYSASSKSYNIAMDRLGLSGSYTAKELFSLTDVSISGTLSTSVAAKDAKIFRIPTIASITTAPTASSLTFGQTLASSTLTGGSGSVSGTFAFANPSTLPATGTTSHSVTFTPSLASNLRRTTTMVSVTVNKATPTIVSLPTASAITVGDTLASSTLTGGSASTPGTFRFTTPSTSPSAGTSNQSITFTPTDTTNYQTTTGTVSVVVNPVEVPPAPEITGSGTFSAFSSTYANASSAQTFTVSGVDLSTGITAAAPAGFEVSADGLSYAASIAVGAAGTIAPTTISVRLAASTPAGSYSGNITLNSAGATQQILSISSGTVAAKSLTVIGLTGINKFYDGNKNAAASGTASLSGVVGADDVALSGTPDFTFDSANAGTGIAITTTGYTLSGLNAGNYTLTQPSLSANITAKELTISGLIGDNKIYDGNTAATAIGTASLSGVVGADDVALSGTPDFTFDSANAGTGIAITTKGYTLIGLNAGNYSLTQPSLSANITAKELTISGLTGVSKVYDGNTAATAIGTASLSGVVGSDDVALSGTPVFTFDSANAGTGIAITTTGYTLIGLHAANYTLTQP